MADYTTFPPQEQLRVPMPIIRVRAGQELKVVFRSSCWHGRNTHYVAKRTTLCGEDDYCGYCDHHTKIWKGFAVVRAFSSDRLALLSLTPLVIPTLAAAMNCGGSATGLIAVFRRLGRYDNSPLHVDTFGHLPKEPSVTVQETKAWVERIFKADKSYNVLAAMRKNAE